LVCIFNFFSSYTGVYFAAERVEAHLPADIECITKGIKKLFELKTSIDEQQTKDYET
jgi:hypothetical protein